MNLAEKYSVVRAWKYFCENVRKLVLENQKKVINKTFSAYGSPSELKVSDLTFQNLAPKISSGTNIHKSWRIILYLNDRKNSVIYR